MDSLVGLYSEEKDILYRIGELKGMQKGMKKGREEGKEEARIEDKEIFAKTLLLNTGFSVSRIAGLVNATEYFVRKIKKSLK